MTDTFREFKDSARILEHDSARILEHDFKDWTNKDFLEYYNKFDEATEILHILDRDMHEKRYEVEELKRSEVLVQLSEHQDQMKRLEEELELLARSSLVSRPRLVAMKTSELDTLKAKIAALKSGVATVEISIVFKEAILDDLKKDIDATIAMKNQYYDKLVEYFLWHMAQFYETTSDESSGSTVVIKIQHPADPYKKTDCMPTCELLTSDYMKSQYLSKTLDYYDETVYSLRLKYCEKRMNGFTVTFETTYKLFVDTTNSVPLYYEEHRIGTNAKCYYKLLH
jgi:hypothetical protein